MARCSAGGRTSAVPTATNGPSLYATATSGSLYVVEIQVFNTTATAVALSLGISTARGTVGAALNVVNESDQTHSVLGTAYNTHTVAPTVTNTRHASLGAAIGAGMVWTFAAPGLHIPEGTANGVVITCHTGTGQHLDFSFLWDE